MSDLLRRSGGRRTFSAPSGAWHTRCSTRLGTGILFPQPDPEKYTHGAGKYPEAAVDAARSELLQALLRHPEMRRCCFRSVCVKKEISTGTRASTHTSLRETHVSY